MRVRVMTDEEVKARDEAEAERRKGWAGIVIAGATLWFLIWAFGVLAGLFQ